MAPAVRKATVLVVEDDRPLRDMYRAALAAAGYTVIAVEDGVDALAVVEHAPPNLIVLDLALPRLSGHDVQRELASRAETRDIPILVVTGGDAQDFALIECCGILKKPVQTDALVAAVDHGLRVADRSRATLGAARREAASPRPLSMDPASRARRRARSVLIVDDEVAVRQLLQQFLEEKGYTVKTAGSVGDAIFALEPGLIDAVVLDVRMPRRSGLELLEFMRVDVTLGDVPVLILTGATLTPHEEAVVARGRGHLFHKGDDLEALALHLDRVTG